MGFFLILTLALGCGEPASKTPEGAVEAMLKAAKAGNYQKAVEYFDFEGMQKQYDERIAKLPEEVRKNVPKFDFKEHKKRMIEQLKEDAKKGELTWKIGETKIDGDIATVELETFYGGKSEGKDKVPMVKVKGVWKVGMPAMPEMPIPES